METLLLMLVQWLPVCLRLRHAANKATSPKFHSLVLENVVPGSKHAEASPEMSSRGCPSSAFHKTTTAHVSRHFSLRNSRQPTEPTAQSLQSRSRNSKASSADPSKRICEDRALGLQNPSCVDLQRHQMDFRVQSLPARALAD